MVSVLERFDCMTKTAKKPNTLGPHITQIFHVWKYPPGGGREGGGVISIPALLHCFLLSPTERRQDAA